MELVGKSAVVTGASRGIGKAIAEALAAAGAQVALLARSERALHAVADGIEAEGGQALVGAGRCCRRRLGQCGVFLDLFSLG